jgi:hypothetical protein
MDLILNFPFICTGCRKPIDGGALAFLNVNLCLDCFNIADSIRVEINKKKISYGDGSLHLQR